MKGYEYIISKQVQWALNQGIRLIGSAGDKGRLCYTDELEKNLFMPLTESVRTSFNQGNGNEVVGTSNKPAKMQALHSSSALAVNVFQYWEKIDQVSRIIGLVSSNEKEKDQSCKLLFEEKYPIVGINRIPPNIDVLIHNPESCSVKRTAIECKFSEPYGAYKHNGLNPAYLVKENLWDELPHLKNHAKSISPENTEFQYLDSAQLIKHILGLRSQFAKRDFQLVYLWYDVLGHEGGKHKDEMDEFSKIAQSDNIQFKVLSYQDLIILLADSSREEHPNYINYLTARYL
jgi:hypothetical protein